MHQPSDQPYKTSSFTTSHLKHPQAALIAATTGQHSVLSLSLSNTPNDNELEEPTTYLRTEDCPENYLSEQFHVQHDFERQQYLRYPLSLINTQRLLMGDGEENCTCSSDEELEEADEVVLPMSSVRRMTTTDYGGREVVETDTSPIERGVHKNIFQSVGSMAQLKQIQPPSHPLREASSQYMFLSYSNACN